MRKQLIIDGEVYEIWKRSEIRKLRFSSFTESTNEVRIPGEVGKVNGIKILDESKLSAEFTSKYTNVNKQ